MSSSPNMSRLHKWGSIFSRLDGLLQHGGLKKTEKPFWYDIYMRFPPFDEPNYGRPAKEVQIRQIFYPEDKIRAEVQKKFSNTVNLIDLTNEQEKTYCQKCIKLFNTYISEGLNEKDSLEKATEKIKKSDFSVTIENIFIDENK